MCGDVIDGGAAGSGAAGRVEVADARAVVSDTMNRGQIVEKGAKRNKKKSLPVAATSDGNLQGQVGVVAIFNC